MSGLFKNKSSLLDDPVLWNYFIDLKGQGVISEDGWQVLCHLVNVLLKEVFLISPRVSKEALDKTIKEIGQVGLTDYTARILSDLAERELDRIVRMSHLLIALVKSREEKISKNELFTIFDLMIVSMRLIYDSLKLPAN